MTFKASRPGHDEPGRWAADYFRQKDPGRLGWCQLCQHEDVPGVTWRRVTDGRAVWRVVVCRRHSGPGIVTV